MHKVKFGKILNIIIASMCNGATVHKGVEKGKETFLTSVSQME